MAPPSKVVAILGLGAAYTGHCGRPIGAPAFVAMNLLSPALIFSHLTVTLVCGAGVLVMLIWHAPPQPAGQAARMTRR